MVWVYVVIIAMCAGMVKGISGFGSSLVSIPLLTLLYTNGLMDGIITDIANIVVVMVTFNLFLNALLLVENKGFHPDSLQRVWLIPLFGTIFTIVGIYILVTVNEVVVTYVAFGLIVLAILIRGFQFNITLPDTPITKAVVGALSGIGNGIASIDGPPVVFYLTAINAEKQYFKNVLAAHFLVMGVVAVVFHIIWASYTTDLVVLTAVMLGGTIVGLLIGMRISRYLNQDTFDKVILVILFFLAISILF